MASSVKQPPDAGGSQQSPPHELPSNHVDGESTSPHPPAKAVCFPDESISPLMIGKNKELDPKDHLDLDKTAKQYAASVGRKRLSGRPSVEPLSLQKLKSPDSNPNLPSLLSDTSIEGVSPGHHAHEPFLKQIGAWLTRERNRRLARRAKRKAHKDEAGERDNGLANDADPSTSAMARRGSDSSEEGTAALDQLAQIVESALSIKATEAKKKIAHLRRPSGGLKRHSAISVDSDYFDSVDQLVPGCDAILDNSKTMAYCTDEAGPEPVGKESEERARKEKEAWTKFRFEILRIAHTLKLKGWRKVSMDQSDEIDVQRLSGALTNAVYAVSPPKNLLTQGEAENSTPKPRNPPPKLLLRIYGPQVEHLIDRECELQVLARLARKRIGPRLLGTFQNGRFEQFLDAKPLTTEELRIPDTSIQIAKRIRELHDGIDLLKNEREYGPFVWQNWDKWVDRCEQIVTWLDQQFIESTQNPHPVASNCWKTRGFVCGVKWPIFRQTIEKYRAWLEKQYGGIDKINERMVFSHNDTQYGNILRMEPEKESPLLLPANQHKQLVVIDFEYANANLPGLEFANHFTEWNYNYHDAEAPWRCKTQYYPKPEEQHRFIQAYLAHNPEHKAAGGYTSHPITPHLGPLPLSGSACAAAATAAPSKINAFMLDSRAPLGEKFQEQEIQAERQIEEEVKRLMAETKLWRLANSAQWVAWGIVQAQIPGMPEFKVKGVVEDQHATAGQEKVASENDAKAQDVDVVKPQDEEEDDEEEFDYLSYANDRALFLWGDAIQLGIVKAEELPEELRQRLKVVEY